MKTYKVNGWKIRANSVGTAVSAYCNKRGINKIVGKEIKVYRDKKWLCTYKVTRENCKYPRIIKI
jgi:hypothetical protein